MTIGIIIWMSGISLLVILTFLLSLATNQEVRSIWRSLNPDD